MSDATPRDETAGLDGDSAETGRSRSAIAFALLGLLLILSGLVGWPWLSAWNEHRYLFATVELPDGQGESRTLLIFHPTIDTPISERPAIAITKSVAPVRIQTRARSSVYVSLRAWWWSGWRWRSKEIGLTAAGDPHSESGTPTRLEVITLGETRAILIEVYAMIDSVWAMDGGELRDVSRSHREPIKAWVRARREGASEDKP